MTSEQIAKLPVHFHAANYTEWVDPSRTTVAEIAAMVREAVEREATAAGVASPGEVAAVIAERVSILIEPDFEAWIKVVERSGGSLPGINEETAGETYKRRWALETTAFANAPISPENCKVLTIAPNEPYQMVPGTSFARSSPNTGALYPAPPQDGPSVQAVEVLIPIRFKTVDSPTHDLPSTIAIRLFRSQTGPAWRPYNFIVYNDDKAEGKVRTFPVF